MNDFASSNEIGSIYQDILSRELLNYGIVIQCHTSCFFQMNYGENPQGIEIKYDSKVETTNNIFFEFEAINKKGDKFIKGGIEKQDNAWLYIIGNGKECWIFAKNQLQSLFRKVKQNPQTFREKGITLRTHIDKDTNKPTANGMCVSLDYIESNNLAINHIVFRKDYTQWIINTTL